MCEQFKNIRLLIYSNSTLNNYKTTLLLDYKDSLINSNKTMKSHNSSPSVKIKCNKNILILINDVYTA